MKFTFVALDKLAAQAQFVRQRATSLVDAQQHCQPLAIAIQKLREAISPVKPNAPKLTVDQAWSRLSTANFDLNALDALEFRALCCDDQTAVRQEFLTALERTPEKLYRLRCMYGLAHGYFAHWRTMATAPTIERFLRTAVIKSPRRAPFVQKWAKTAFLFSPESASGLASEICDKHSDIDEVLKSYFVDPLTRLALEVRSKVASVAGESFDRLEKSNDEEWALRYLDWLTQKVFSDLTSQNIFAATVSLLILSESAAKCEAFRRALQGYIQKHKRLGDPRLREFSPNWVGMVPAAAKRYLSWLARDSIAFFFNTILPDSSENQRRKDFWLYYHDSIRDFQVAVSDNDLPKVKSAPNMVPGSYSQVLSPATASAFLMVFDGYGGEQYVVVEFSETGNAAYIFKMSDFVKQNVTLRTPHFNLKRHLKFDSKNRILHHTGDWVQDAYRKLASEFGIRP